MVLDDLKIGQIYKRKELHKQFGGQPQSGISTPRQFPVIFIFTGESGQTYGYSDVWGDDGLYRYSGEGQDGGMVFKRGNKALRDHRKNEKKILLLKKRYEVGFVKLIAELHLRSYEFIQAPDMNGNERRAIQFVFEKVEKSNFI